MPLEERIVFGREQALRMIRGRFASSFALIGDDEYRAGLDRAERVLPGRIEVVMWLVVLTARR